MKDFLKKFTIELVSSLIVWGLDAWICWMIWNGWGVNEYFKLAPAPFAIVAGLVLIARIIAKSTASVTIK